MRVAARKGDVKGATTMINKNHKGLADRAAKFKKYQAQKLQSGGIVPVQKFQAGGNVRPTPTSGADELYNKYDAPFYKAQARKATSTPIIICF